MLIPRIEHSRFWHRLLHDRTANSIVQVLTELPHANVTIVPYQLGRRQLMTEGAAVAAGLLGAQTDASLPVPSAGAIPLAEIQARREVTITGRVHSVRTQPRAEVATFECVVRDHTGTITLAFLGRKHIAGIEPGTWIKATGRVGVRQGRHEIVNPEYELLSPVGQ